MATGKRDRVRMSTEGSARFRCLRERTPIHELARQLGCSVATIQGLAWREPFTASTIERLEKRLAELVP